MYTYIRQKQEGYISIMANTFISSQGYSINKAALTDEDLEKMRMDLSVTPNIPQDYNMNPLKPFKLFQEGPNKIYVPKFYGIQQLGHPDVCRIEDGDSINVEFTGSLRDEQQPAIKAYLQALEDPYKKGGLLNLTCASGKCLGRDTPVMLFNGNIKMVQDVIIGDILMGDDSSQRTVESTCFGYEKMYKVCQQQGDTYSVNESHILSVIYDNAVLDIPITEYMKHPQKHLMFGFKKPVVFQFQNITIDPYLVGCIYGSQEECDITKVSNWKYDLNHIPLIYKANHESVQLSVLAGLIDTCGRTNIDEYQITVIGSIINDIKFICTSLNIGCKMKNNKLCILYGNNIMNIPTKTVMVKVSNMNVQNISNIYNIKIEEMDIGEYYGFEISGVNRRFLLGDFTVTHNTVMAIYLMCHLKQKSIVIVHKDFLLQQWKERIEQFAPNARIGTIKAKTIDVVDKDIVLASLQSLSMKDYDKEVFKGFGFVIVDECHHTSAEVFCRALRKVAFKYTLGLSATIRRKDGLSKVFKWYLGDVVYSNVRKKNNDTVHVDCKYFYEPDPSYSKEWYMMGKKLNISRMINNVCEYTPRVDFVVNCVRETLLKEPGRKIIILSDRRIHLENIGNGIQTLNIPYGYYFGGMKQDDLKKSENQKVILGTFCMVSEGFDCKSLDTLIIASPKSDVVQSVGRILREEVHNRKHIPLVIDIIDQFSIFERQAQKRLKYYKTQKYTIIGTPLIQDNKCVKLEGHCFANME
jgi:superfamily II DNA or RNA helicase